jgi:hypothetical protein
MFQQIEHIYLNSYNREGCNKLLTDRGFKKIEPEEKNMNSNEKRKNIEDEQKSGDFKIKENENFEASEESESIKKEEL